MLSDLSDHELASRFDPSDMSAKEIYPEIWEADAEDEDGREYLMENVITLREFLCNASGAKLGMVVHLS